jgi:hypothetical protein
LISTSPLPLDAAHTGRDEAGGLTPNTATTGLIKGSWQTN